MADAQTPAEPPRAYAGRERGAWEHGYAAGLAAQPDRAVMQQALDAIAPRFRSGNAVPVDKATVPAAEWHALVAALENSLAP